MRVIKRGKGPNEIEYVLEVRAEKLNTVEGRVNMGTGSIGSQNNLTDDEERAEKLGGEQEKAMISVSHES